MPVKQEIPAHIFLQIIEITTRKQNYLLFFYGMGIHEAFDPTGLFPRVAPAKPTQIHTRQLAGKAIHSLRSWIILAKLLIIRLSLLQD